MNYADFYDIANYGNVAWKGSYTPKEVACNAYTYLCEYEYGKKQGKQTEVIKELIRLLLVDEIVDESYECLEWASRILEEE